MTGDQSKRAPGRPPVADEALRCVPVGMRIPRYIWEHLGTMPEPNAALVTRALIARYKIPKPGARKRKELIAAKDEQMHRITFVLQESAIAFLDKLAADNPGWGRNKALQRLLRMESRRGLF